MVVLHVILIHFGNMKRSDSREDGEVGDVAVVL